MESKQHTGLLWAIGLLLILLGVIYFSSTPGPTQSLKIGVIAPLTGDAAVYGTAVQRGYDLAVYQINESGGVKGQQIELIYEDGKCEGSAATTAAQKLINIDQVQYILGGACSGEMLAAAELTQDARVLLISGTATSPDITDAGDLVYRTYPSDDFEAIMIAGHATENGYDSVAIISENTDFAQGVRGAFLGVYEGEVVFDEAFNTGETDFRTLVTKMRSVSPDAVYVVPQSPASGELILKQMRELGVNASIYGANTLLDRGSIEENSQVYEGMILTEVQLPEGGVTEKMLADYEQMYGEAPEFTAFTASTYDSVYLIAAAIEAGATDAEGVAAYFNTDVNDWEGTIGVFNFDDNGDAELELTLIQVVDGELVALAGEDEEPTENTQE